MPPVKGSRKKQRVDNAGVTTSDTEQTAATETSNGEATQQAFTVNNSTEPRAAVERVSIALKSDGTVDWDSMRDGTKAKVKAFLSTDPQARMMITGAPADVRMVQPKHVEGLLGIVEMLERFAWPKIIEKQTDGKIKITPDIAAQVFKFTDVEKKEIAEPGSLFLDTHLPLNIKQWIANAGPGAEALALIIKAEQRKVQTAAMMAVIAANKKSTDGVNSSILNETVTQ